MYHYVFNITPARQKSGILFTAHEARIKEAIEAINGGISFKRDRKCLTLLNIDDREMSIRLTSPEPLKNPARSLSALTRYLTTKYPDVFEPYIYNKTLFNIHALSQETTPTPKDEFRLSNEEVLKGIIDLLYTYPNTREVKAAKAQIVQILQTVLNKGD